MLKIKKETFDEIIDHAEKDLPIEACGYLAEKDGLISKCFQMTNLDKSGEHFTMDPKEQFAVLKEVRESQFNLVAAYHSHPETPARPSEEDIRCAYDPQLSYVIVSMAEPERIMKSFKIKDGNVSHEAIEIEG